MAETKRTQNDLLTLLFQDGQIDGSISPQDMRDFIVSTYGAGKIVTIEQKSDFPPPNAGTITLAADTCYRIVNDVDIGTDVLSINSGFTLLDGPSDNLVTLETSSANPLITATKGIEIRNLTIKNDVGPCISFTGGSVDSITIRDSIITSAGNDIFAGGAAHLMFNSQFAFGSAGLVISGTWNLGLFSNSTWRNITGILTFCTIQTGTTYRAFQMNGSQMILGPNQTGIDIATDVLPVAGGSVNNTIFDTSASGARALTPGKIDQTIIGWNFLFNSGIEDSAHAGAIEFSGNTSVTTINTINVFETIATGVVWAIDPISERFIIRVADSESLEHIGEKKMRTLVTYNATIEGASANQKFEVRLLLNGVEVDKARWDYRTAPLNVSHTKIVTMDKNDYLTIQVRNTTGTANVTVTDAQITAVKSG